MNCDRILARDRSDAISFDWWWRNPDFFSFHPENFRVHRKEDDLAWRVEDEPIAWTLELVRRNNKQLQLPRFLDLDWDVWWRLSNELQKANLNWIKSPLPMIWDFSPRGCKPGWIPLDALKVNLAASDRQLFSWFRNL